VVPLELLVFIEEAQVRIAFRHLYTDQFFIPKEAEFSQGFFEVTHAAEKLCSYSRVFETKVCVKRVLSFVGL